MAKAGALVKGAQSISSGIQMKQHTSPCFDCPWRRNSLRGWLGDKDARYWLSVAHSDVINHCHMHPSAQCAGMAIYRANVSKFPYGKMLDLPVNLSLVFASPAEFCSHHRVPVPTILPFGFIESDYR